MPESDAKVLSYGDVLLRKADVDILRGPHWLNDQIISFYYEYLTHNKLQGDEDVLLLPPATAFLIANCGDIETIAPILEPLKLQERQTVFFPINNNTKVESAGGGSHWSLLVYLASSNTFLHFDSASGMNTEAARLMYSVLGPMYRGSKFTEAISPQQENGFDCGMYVLAITGVLLEKAPELGKQRDGCQEINTVKDLGLNAETAQQLRANILEAVNRLSM